MIKKVTNSMGDVAYAIEPEDWESFTGEKPETDPVFVVIKPLFTRCEWEFNIEHDRWDTECGDVVVLLNRESPFDCEFMYCPYCGKRLS